MHQSSIGVSDPETVLKEFLNSVTFSVHRDQIACFSPNGRTLEVLTSVMRVSSMDEGVSKALRLLPDELQGALQVKRGSSSEYPWLELLARHFLIPKTSEIPRFD
jgi:hypothetical protein